MHSLNVNEGSNLLSISQIALESSLYQLEGFVSLLEGRGFNGEKHNLEGKLKAI
jgi:hypothetical protein